VKISQHQYQISPTYESKCPLTTSAMGIRGPHRVNQPQNKLV